MSADSIVGALLVAFGVVYVVRVARRSGRAYLTYDDKTTGRSYAVVVGNHDLALRDVRRATGARSFVCVARRRYEIVK